jgi:hypothetical protein
VEGASTRISRYYYPYGTTLELAIGGLPDTSREVQGKPAWLVKWAGDSARRSCHREPIGNLTRCYQEARTRRRRSAERCSWV